MTGAILLRKWRGKLTAALRGGGYFQSIDLHQAGGIANLAFGLALLLVPVVLVLGLIAAMLAPTESTLALHPFGAMAFVGITLAEKRKNLEKITKEAESIEAEFKGKAMPEDKGTQLEKLYTEGEALSVEIDNEIRRDKQRKTIADTMKALGEVDDPALPGGEGKSVSRIAGYITPGQLFAVSDQLQAFKAARFPRGKVSDLVEMKGLLPIKGIQGEGLIALTQPEVEQFKALVEKAEKKDVTDVIPVFGTDVIAPNRVDRFVQVTRPDRLTLRDVLNVSPTSSPVIDYVREESYSESAGIVSEGATKPQAGIEYSKQRANVVTIATWIPVTEQQLQDAPALINRINTRLLWDVRKAEEQEVGYGDGTGEHFEGLFDSGSGISAMRDEVGDTLIDIVRRGITDVMTDGYDPNALWIHPIDWETIELAKGSDGQYVWAIIRDTLGPRIWGVRVVQGVGTRKNGDTTTNMAVGDWLNGATLYDRQQAAIQVGWINEQFIENLRTIRAEERVAWALEAPKAFRIYETAA